MNKHQFFIAAGLFVMLTAFITGCAKDQGKLPASTQTPAPSPSACDTVTYNKHIKPIIDANCALSGCHAGTTSNPQLTSYALVKDRADAGRIKARVIDANPSQMPPPPGALTAAQKQLITCWLDNGKKE